MIFFSVLHFFKVLAEIASEMEQPPEASHSILKWGVVLSGLIQFCWEGKNRISPAAFLIYFFWETTQMASEYISIYVSHVFYS